MKYLPHLMGLNNSNSRTVTAHTDTRLLGYWVSSSPNTTCECECVCVIKKMFFFYCHSCICDFIFLLCCH